PGLLVALGTLVTTDLPSDRLPDLAAIAEMYRSAIYRAMMKQPLAVAGKCANGEVPRVGPPRVGPPPGGRRLRSRALAAP
ncbi:MAG: hypothetical protein ABIV26_08895, partial [Candidatus Limnocylindrales bacterium]